MTWEIVVGLIAILGALVTICGVVVKVNGTLVRLEDAIERLNAFMESQNEQNTRMEKNFMDHESRISRLETYHSHAGHRKGDQNEWQN